MSVFDRLVDSDVRFNGVSVDASWQAMHEESNSDFADVASNSSAAAGKAAKIRMSAKMA